MTTKMRLPKYFSSVGFCSRRAAEKLIKEGRVRVDGVLISEPGHPIVPDKSRIEVDGRLIKAHDRLVYVAIHKPSGVISSRSDPEGRPVVTDLIPSKLGRLWPVGRLDWNSDGLLLLTNDGTLTHLLTHPSGGVEKIYHVKLRGMIAHKDPGLQAMRDGITLDDGYETRRSEVSVVSNTGKHTWVEIVLHEGRNRQIRRMCEAVGYTVLRLRRMAIGPLQLESLPAEAWRFLEYGEVNALYHATGESAPSNLTKRYAGFTVFQNLLAPRPGPKKGPSKRNLSSRGSSRRSSSREMTNRDSGQSASPREEPRGLSRSASRSSSRNSSSRNASREEERNSSSRNSSSRNSSSRSSSSSRNSSRSSSRGSSSREESHSASGQRRGSKRAGRDGRDGQSGKRSQSRRSTRGSTRRRTRE